MRVDDDCDEESAKGYMCISNTTTSLSQIKKIVRSRSNAKITLIDDRKRVTSLFFQSTSDGGVACVCVKARRRLILTDGRRSIKSDSGWASLLEIDKKFK